MLSHVLFMLWLTASTLGTPIHKSCHRISHASHEISTRRFQSPFKLDRQAALAARTATQKKFQNAPSLLAGLGMSPGYDVPSSLQDTYNRASDYATNITLLRLSSLFRSPAAFSSYSLSAIRVAATGSLPSAFVDPLQDDTNGVDDYEYYGPMNFGSQAQSLQVDFDTGSADAWVPVDCSDCGKLSSFQTNASSTYQDTKETFGVRYGSGAVVGTLARDTVSLGPLRVYNQSIGAVHSVSPNFVNAPNAGLVGMAFSTIANSRQPTFFENLIPQLRAPLFSVYMTRNQVRGSEIYFGGIDTSKASEDAIRWVQVVSKTYWTVNMTAALVNGTRVDTMTVNTIIDTGTSFIYLPTHVMTAIYRVIPDAFPAPDYGDGFFAYPCASQTTISFILGSETLVLDPRDFNLGSYESDLTGRTCIAALVDAGPDLSFAILGDSFLKSYVSIYDYSYGARVGFVKSINE